MGTTPNGETKPKARKASRINAEAPQAPREGIEMTTTASKAGLRAKAEATRTKAAQRTPLPPKPGTAKHRDEQIASGQERKRVRRAAEDAKAETQAKKDIATEARRSKDPKPAKAPKSDKATIYAGEMTKLGWHPEVTRLDGLHELIATRGNEALYLAWMNEAHVPGTSTYTIADRTVKVRNPAEAMRVAALKPTEAKAVQEKVSSNVSFRKRPTGPTIRRIPFDVETATEEELRAALEAHEIRWHNQYRVNSEEAIVGNAKSIHVSRHKAGHRILSFVDPQFGYRALRLEHLENVGSKVNLAHIRQEILKSLSRPDRKAKAA